MPMARDEERAERAQQDPIVGGLPDVPGIGVAMRLRPGLGVHLRGLADELLVNDYPGTTLRRDQRELIATAVSAENDCFFCMDSHGAFATALLERDGSTQLVPLIEIVKTGSSEGLDEKMCALLFIARTLAETPRGLTEDDIRTATDAGATDEDVQLAVLIASGFSMYNRLVEGFRARTAPTTHAYRERAGEIAEHGYSAPVPEAAGRQLPGGVRGRRPTARAVNAASDAVSGACAVRTTENPASRAAWAAFAPAATTGVARSRARAGPSARPAQARAMEPLVTTRTSIAPASRMAASRRRDASGASTVR